MKRKKLIIPLIVMGLLVVLTTNCKKDDDESDNQPVKKIPVLTTNAASNIKSTTATSGGNVTSDEGFDVTARGVCWSINNSPTIDDIKTNDGTGVGTYTSNLTGLSPGTKYYLRAYATNSEGTGYGNEVSFTTSSTITDVEGNIYNTVEIGSQTWLVENLKVTKLNDGTDIPNVTDETTWNNLNTPAYCWYDNDVTYRDTYGALYNWHTVNTAKLCPTGWHVASNAEWESLISHLGGVLIAKNNLKEAGLDHWLGSNEGTNSSGFTALPGGYRSIQWGFESINYHAQWWTSTETSSTDARGWAISSGLSEVHDGTFWKEDGFSVRCIKN